MTSLYHYNARLIIYTGQCVNLRAAVPQEDNGIRVLCFIKVFWLLDDSVVKALGLLSFDKL